MVSALIGGALIGVAALLMLGGLGRIAVVSGVIGGSLRRAGLSTWRVAFMAGMLVVGGVARAWAPETLVAADGRPLWVLAVGGLLVGLGTRVGNGCTSGHGVCGIGLRSRRSVVATMIFMFTSVVTVGVLRLWTGGLS